MGSERGPEAYERQASNGTLRWRLGDFLVRPLRGRAVGSRARLSSHFTLRRISSRACQVAPAQKRVSSVSALLRNGEGSAFADRIRPISVICSSRSDNNDRA
jgi:hypothetical protein